MQVNKTSIPGAANTPKNYLAADHPFKEEKMKVTLLIATCTLVVLLQQMQAPMAKPLDLEPPVELNDICELIVPFHSIEYMMVGTYQNYFYRIHGCMKFLLLSHIMWLLYIIARRTACGKYHLCGYLNIVLQTSDTCPCQCPYSL